MERKKHAVVTGGGKGVGAACCRILNREGFYVSILDIDQAAGRGLEQELSSSRYLRCDVSKAEEVSKAIAEAIKHFGEIELLVNNAGIQLYGSITETSEEAWDRLMNINLKSYFLCAKEVIPSMQRNGKGVIVNVSSVQAFITQKSVAAYTTAKTALLGLTRSIAVDYSPQIRSVAICPGTIDTPMLRNALSESPHPQKVFEECEEMHLLKRVGQPEEVAELIAFVASEKAAFMTGQAIRIDGGLGIEIAGSRREE
ncbi:SDR family oxidoreductase [Salinimicrobium sp. TIG7-5_MAKvit]|uniref:SDR family oxidoreductase n=1 Tax=Salinimicrobium sp. TIG7-5_MAKvit TaxID=3121289 RepID=UPI003C6E4307